MKLKMPFDVITCKQGPILVPNHMIIMLPRNRMSGWFQKTMESLNASLSPAAAAVHRLAVRTKCEFRKSSERVQIFAIFGWEAQSLFVLQYRLYISSYVQWTRYVRVLALSIVCWVMHTRKQCAYLEAVCTLGTLSAECAHSLAPALVGESGEHVSSLQLDRQQTLILRN